MFDLSFSDKKIYIQEKNHSMIYSCKINRSLIHCCNRLQSLCNVFNDFCTPLNTA